MRAGELGCTRSPLSPQISDRLLHQIDSIFNGRSPPEYLNYKFALIP
ncbi:MAG: hypothetical protein KGQ16_03495 [Cyanobacteria bacterium REEB444]|nr:hypothetical protein [Cyanobacteria bacterium REEB444]